MKKALLTAPLLLLAAVYYYSTRQTLTTAPIATSASAKTVLATPSPVALTLAAEQPAKPQYSPMADTLNTSESTGKEDVEILYMILEQYLSSLQRKGGPPLGDDTDLVHVLTGRNPMRVIFLPAQHHAISPQGRLLDRWGTPYHLHSLSSVKYQIRSAGQDKKLFNQDDLVWPEDSPQ